MGVVIQCNNKIIHSTYTEISVFRNELLNASIRYINNEITQKINYNPDFLKKNIIGIKIFLYKNKFSANDSILFINSLLHIYKFINITQNMYMLFCMFLYSVKTNTDLVLK